MKISGEGAEWVEQLRAPRQGHCTSQSQPVKATLLRRAVTLCATVARWLRRQNGFIWYYLVHDNLFVSGHDWGTIIFAALFWKKATTPGIIAGMVAGFVVCVGWKLAGVPFGLGSAVPGAIACGIALVVVSLLTCKKHPSVYLKAHKELPPEASAE